MENFDRKKHWEKIYQTKALDEVSWFQRVPVISLGFLKEYEISKTARIIDIGGGDSLLVDNLIDLGYQNITVLDISETSLERAKGRLGDDAEKVNWIVADAANFNPYDKYDFWHDRAVFHFLTNEEEINNYIGTLQRSINKDGILVIGTFSEQGPTKCSGIEIKQYSETSLTQLLKNSFERIKCVTVNHITPTGAAQNFIFCIFKKL